MKQNTDLVLRSAIVITSVIAILQLVRLIFFFTSGQEMPHRPNSVNEKRLITNLIATLLLLMVLNLIQNRKSLIIDHNNNSLSYQPQNSNDWSKIIFITLTVLLLTMAPMLLARGPLGGLFDPRSGRLIIHILGLIAMMIPSLVIALLIYYFVKTVKQRKQLQRFQEIQNFKDYSDDVDEMILSQNNNEAE